MVDWRGLLAVWVVALGGCGGGSSANDTEGTGSTGATLGTPSETGGSGLDSSGDADSGDSPCEGIDCSDHGVCIINGGEPSCECDPGFTADGVSCVEDVEVLELVAELRLPEHAGVSRSREAVRSGIPLPQGLVGPDDPLALFEGETRLPTQARALSRWPDGSVRWLLIDTVVDLAAEQSLPLSLYRLARAVETPLPIVVSETAEEITVDTGPMQVTIPRSFGAGLGTVVVDGTTVIDAAAGPSAERGPFTNDAWGAAQTTESTPLAGGPVQTYLDYESGTGMPAVEFHRRHPWNLEVNVEEAGPLHAVVRISGAHLHDDGSTSGRYTTRLHFAREARHVDVQHQWVYTGAGSEDPVDRYGWTLPFASTARAAEGEAAEVASITHTAYDQYRRNGSEQAGQAVPLIEASDGDVAIAIALRDMAETFPKALVADDTTLRMELYAASEPDWDLARYSAVLGLGENPGSSVGAQGLGTGDFARVYFTTSGFDGGLSQDARAFDAGPLQLWASPQWYSDAAVMGMGPFAFDPSLARSEVHYRIDRILEIVERWMRFNRDRFAWYGIEDYGDIRGWFEGGANDAQWLVEGRYGWSGNSGEPSNQLWLQCLRTQTRACFDDAAALAQHTMDQQMIHFGSELLQANTTFEGAGRTRPFSVGSLHRHGMQPYSGFAEQPEYSHLGGVETYYYLTGDAAARDALYEAAQFVYRFDAGDLIATAAVNGVDVLSRVAAIEHDTPHAARFETRVDEMLDRLLSGTTLEDRLSNADDLDFIRALRGPQYHAERTGSAEAAQVILRAASVVVANADDWELTLDASAAQLKLVVTIVNHAVLVAEQEGVDPEPYRALAQRMLELASLANDGDSHAALSLDLLQSLPASDDGWLWEYDEDNPASLLWVARQPAFRNDDMMGYHFYRNFEALMTGAAAISPDTPGLTPR